MKKNQSVILEFIESIYDEYKDLHDGAVADYIPELGLADPNWFGIVIATVDGKLYTVGDTDKEFTIQSISKAYTYAIALEDNGVDHVLSKVGIEPSGDLFNAISLNENGRPANPMINAGAIATTGLVKSDGSEVIEKIRDKYSQFAGRELSIDKKVYQSESNTGHRNRAIGHMLRNFNIIESDPNPILENYFQQCSILVNCKDLAVMAATLANNGINPVTNNRVIDNQYVKNVLSVMSSCGMYDYSGSWMYNIGLPAKSGVGGGILTVLPGQLGIAVFSPPLDDKGNSCRGIKVLERLSQKLNLHTFNVNELSPNAFIRSTLNLTSMSSNKRRNQQETDLLTEHGESVLIFTLQGNITFSSYELIMRAVLSSLNNTKYVVFNLGRVFDVDSHIVELFLKLFHQLSKMDTTLLFCEEDGNLGLSKYFLVEDKEHKNLFFEKLMDVVEWLEDEIIDLYIPRKRDDIAFELKDFKVCNTLNIEDINYLKEKLEPVVFEKTDIIIGQGEDADSLFFLTKGNVDVSFKADHKIHKVASCGPGNLVGEMAIVASGPRSAYITAASAKVECLKLSLHDYEKMSTEAPNLKLELLKNIANDLSEKLRIANKNIQLLI